MSVKIIRPYACAPCGHTVLHYKVGDIVTGQAAVFALQDGAGVDLSDFRIELTAPDVETKPSAKIDAGSPEIETKPAPRRGRGRPKKGGAQ